MLPIEQLFTPLSDVWQHHTRFVITAATGSGKSTLLPQWITQQQQGKTLVLQPRRAAVRNLAQFVSQNWQDTKVGYHIAQENKHLDSAKLIYLTDGVFLQQLLHDPELHGIDCVVLDEFHERQINGDVILALLLQNQQLFRPDLKIILMSATLDAVSTAKAIDALPFTASGRSFPVDIHYQAINKIDEIAPLIHQQWQLKQQTILVFLPGLGLINKMATQLQTIDPQLAVFRLHSEVEQSEQSKAINHTTPRIVLASNIAETSITIDDLALVIDFGKEKQSSFSAISQTTHLVERRISQASADQRAGRAGRTSHGQCIRLWSQAEVLAPSQRAHILTSDLRQLVLMLALWGCEIEDLFWFDPPPTTGVSHARQWLILNGLLDANQQISELGKQALAYGCDIGLALMMASIKDQHSAVIAVNWAHQQDLTQSPNHFNHWMRQDLKRWQAKQSAQKQRFAQASEYLAIGFPERVCINQQNSLQSLGGRVFLSKEPLKAAAYFVIDYKKYQHDYVATEYKALPLEHISKQLAHYHHLKQQYHWSGKQLRCEQQHCVGNVVLKSTTRKTDIEHFRIALAQRINELGMPCLLSSDAGQQWLARLELANQYLSDIQPYSLSEWQTSCEHWLTPWLTDCQWPNETQVIRFMSAHLPAGSEPLLHRELPQQIQLPSGRMTDIDYTQSPIRISAKLQELFGEFQLPSLARQQLKLNVDLLAPNGRPVALTGDLGYFWREVYPEVRKELRGRYNKHPWPEDPTTASATVKTNRQLRG